MVAHEDVSVNLDQDGRVTVYSGAAEMGTDIGTVMSQVVADIIGIDIQDIRVNVGDTQGSPLSLGLWGSRGAVTCGSAARLAARTLRDKILRIVAHLLEVPVDDLTIDKGSIYVSGLKTEHSLSKTWLTSPTTKSTCPLIFPIAKVPPHDFLIKIISGDL